MEKKDSCSRPLLLGLRLGVVVVTMALLDLQVYQSSVNAPVRHKCLSVIGKLMYFSTADMIQSMNSITNISSFLAGILAWKDPHVLVPVLQIAEILMEKLSGTFCKLFLREGVVHAVDELILAGYPNITYSRPSVCDKDNSSIPGSSSCRRHRWRRDNSVSDVHAAEGFQTCATSIGLPQTSTKISSVNSSLCMSVTESAIYFKEKYFPLDPSSIEAGATDDLLRLKYLCTRLNTSANGQKIKSKEKTKISGMCSSKEENLLGVISEILSELSKGKGVSTFEFIGSGVVKALLSYLSCGYFAKGRISESNLPKLRQQASKDINHSLRLPSLQVLMKGMLLL